MRFQYISALLLMIFFFSCKQEKELGKNDNENRELVPNPEEYKKDTFIVAKSSSEKNDAEEECDFNSYLTNPQIPPLAKDIFQNKDFNINDATILSFLDSLKATDSSSRRFYFKVVTNSYKKADGYYGEGLGHAGKEYIENNTKEFLSHFTGECKCTKNLLNDWADITMLEINLIAENEDRDVLQKFIRTLEFNCIDCSRQEKEILAEYIGHLKK